MNLQGLIRMVVNLLLRRGLKTMTRPGRPAGPASGPATGPITGKAAGQAAGTGPDPGVSARDAAKRVRKAAQITRRLGR